MKVVKNGRAQKGWAKEFVCTGKGNGGGGCGATLLVEEADLYQTGRSYYDGSSDTFTTFRCISCKVQTDVDVPSSVHVSKSEKPRKPDKSTSNQD